MFNFSDIVGMMVKGGMSNSSSNRLEHALRSGGSSGGSSGGGLGDLLGSQIWRAAVQIEVAADWAVCSAASWERHLNPWVEKATSTWGGSAICSDRFLVAAEARKAWAWA